MNGTTEDYRLIKSTVKEEYEDLFELLLERFTMGYKRQSGGGYSTYYCWMTPEEKERLVSSWMFSIGDDEAGNADAAKDEAPEAVTPDVLPEGMVYVPELEVDGEA